MQGRAKGRHDAGDGLELIESGGEFGGLSWGARSKNAAEALMAQQFSASGANNQEQCGSWLAPMVIGVLAVAKPESSFFLSASPAERVLNTTLM